MIFMHLLIVAAGSPFIVPAAQAFYWQLSPDTPQQCATANVTTYNSTSTGSAIAPLKLLVIPYGPLPLSDASKAIYEIPFNGPNLYSIDFQVKYPAGTQFVELVSDVYGWVGAYNFARTVSSNPDNNSPCWDSPSPKLSFTFSLYPPNRLAQCEETRIYWKADEVQGNPNFLSIIVNGYYFPIQPGIIDDVPGYGRGFIWRPPILVGSPVIIVAGDSRGNSTGGSVVMKVGLGIPFVNSTAGLIGQCPPLNGTGLTYPAVGDKRNSTSSFFNTGTAIGAVLTAVCVFVAIAILLFVKRRRRQRQNNAPVIATPAVAERSHDEKGVQEQGFPGNSDRQPEFYYLPEPMSSPNPGTQTQLGSAPGLLLHYHPGPFPDRSTTTPSTDKDEVVMQPSIPSSIYTGPGMRTDALQEPWSARGSGMSGDTIMSGGSSSQSPTRGLLRKSQAHSASFKASTVGRDYS